MDNVQHPELFAFVLGVSLGMIFTVLMMVRKRMTCALCGKKHPSRPENMTAVEYMKFYCDGQRWIERPERPDQVKLSAVSFFRKRVVVDEKKEEAPID